MKRSFGFLITSFLILAFLSSGCSKKDDNPSAPLTNNNIPPDVPAVSLNGPGSSSNDASLMLVKGYIQGLNGFMNYINKFQNVEAVKSDTGWVRRYLNGSIVATLTTTRLQDGSYSWKLTLSGTNDSVTYNNWLALEGTSSADGKSGTWKVFRDNTNLLTGDYSWQKNSDGSITATLREYRNGSVHSRIEATENADKSGQLLFYLGDNLSFKTLWQSNGSGQWWMFDSSGGVLHQGMWT